MGTKTYFRNAIIACFTLLVAANPASSQTIDRVLAIVDDETITLSEYQSRHRQERFEDSRLRAFDGEVIPRILDLMIDEKIQVKQAVRRGLSVSEREIDEGIQFVARQNNLTVDQLVNQLEGDNFTFEEFRDSLRRQQLMRKLVDFVANSRVVVTDQEINDYISSHAELQNQDEKFEVSHLFIDTAEKTAEQITSEKENLAFIRTSILQGQSFTDAVETYGDGDKSNNGYLGWRSVGELPDLFVNALRDLQPEQNELSEVLQSNNGLHLLKLHSKQGSGQLVRQQLIQHILFQPDNLNTLEETRVKANEIYQLIQDGESFEKLARLHSQDAQSRNEGGSLGWVNPGTTLPAFETAATGLPLNTVSKPVQTRYGYHLIKVLDRREADQANEQARSRARQAVFQRKAGDLYNRWFRNMKQQAFIEYINVE